MSLLFRPYFSDEAAAFQHVEAVLWPQGPVCHHCGAMERIYSLKGVKSKASKKNPEGVERHGLYKCGECRKQFTVRMGTILEESHLPLHKWLQAIHLLCSSKKGISSHQLHRVLECTYKTAWFLSHRIREAMRSGELSPLGGNGVVVEADETYFGNKDLITKRTKRGKPGLASKRAVVGMVERGGNVRTFHVDRATKDDVTALVTDNIAHESMLFTDESKLYGEADAIFLDHMTVKHSDGEYVRGGVHTNTIEGYFSIFKRGMKGVYQHCGEQHLHRYLAEFDFRYNNRSALGVEDSARAVIALLGFKGRRLTYQRAD